MAVLPVRNSRTAGSDWRSSLSWTLPAATGAASADPSRWEAADPPPPCRTSAVCGMAPTRPVDPWGQVKTEFWVPRCPPARPVTFCWPSQVDDLEGTALYSTLELDPRATSDEIKKARGPRR